MRHPQWAERLTAYLSEIRSKPYHPVTHNCAMFALGAIEAVSGRDVLKETGMRLPETEAGVGLMLAEYGDMRRIAERALGEMRGDLLNAQRGDIAVMDGDGGDTLAVVENGATLVLTKNGLERQPLAKAIGYWHV